MHLVRWSASLFGTIAVLAALFAGATIWLLLTDPVTVAESVNQGEVSPLVSAAGHGAVFGAEGTVEVSVGVRDRESGVRDRGIRDRDHLHTKFSSKSVLPVPL